MADSIVKLRKMSNTKLKLSDLNPHLMCVLCGGYYIDATTIVECLHSFCRSCIVKHLESSKYCPICEVQVHKTKPLINIRPDKTLQDIVYKLVPGLYANEMRNRRKFYKDRPHYIKPNDQESSGEVASERKIYVNDENITFSLVYHEGPGPGPGPGPEDSYREFPPPAHNERRYFKCPTGVTVNHLKKLLRAKYELSQSNYKLEIYFGEQELHEDFTLLDVAYVYLWKTKGSLDLTYKIFESVVKRQKIEGNVVEAKEEEEKKAKVDVCQPEGEKETPPKARENGVSSDGKEVQLQISESGVMSVSEVRDTQIVRTLEEPAKERNGEVAPAKARPQPEGGEKKGSKPAKPYKTIRCSPKTWHPVIPKEKLRPTLIKNPEEPRKPLKFFKMRNAPRFLGNPSTGVKPIFGESAPLTPEKKPEPPKPALNKILKIDPKTLRPIEKEEMKMSSAPSAPNLLTNPFIPNNNHFLFSDLHLLPPNSGNYKEKPATSPGGFKAPIPNGSYPPICFPTPEHSPPGFYPFPSLGKPHGFPFPPAEKMDPLLRASRLSPFGNLAGFNVAGFHASLPPSISRLLNPHHHFRKTSPAPEKKHKDESTKETTKRCDDIGKVSQKEEKPTTTTTTTTTEVPASEAAKKEVDDVATTTTTTTTTVTTVTTTASATTTTTTTTSTSATPATTTVDKEKTNEEMKTVVDKVEEKEKKKKEINGETGESASDKESNAGVGETDKDKDR